ncbi:TPA: glycosyltransferase family A protein [Streptococcus suis]
MPVYNRETIVKEAIDSILCQSYQDFKFLIVDDGSEDKAADIIKSYRGLGYI